MNEGVSSITSSDRLHRLLIAEKNFSAIEPLIRTCGDSRLDVHFDVSSSHQGAVALLLASRYQLVISGAHLTEMEDFFLLKRVQALESFVPVVVTADASEKESACRALTKGAFDLLTKPLNHEQTVHTIRLALWQTRLMNLIATKERTIEKCREHLAAYPGDKHGEQIFQKAFLALEKTAFSIEATIQCIEESIQCLTDLAGNVAREARERALQRLDALPKATR
jgi:DNA-binding response OmpR family regulator